MRISPMMICRAARWALAAVVLILCLMLGLALPLRAAPAPHLKMTSPIQTPIVPFSPIPIATPEFTPVPPPTIPIQTPILTPTQKPAPTPTRSLPEIAAETIKENWLLAGFACLVPLLVLGLVLILWGLRRKKPRPEPELPSPPSLPGAPYLEVASTSGISPRFDLKPDGSTIGRAAGNDLVITQDLPAWETVSRQHARIYEQAGRWIVEDLGSVNGVYVNGKRTGRNLLRDGWRLGVGGVEFVFHAGTGEAQR